MENHIKNRVTIPVKQFTRNAKMFIRNCKKPKNGEFFELAKGHIIGLVFLGAIGYIIKVINIPINNILAK